MIKFELTNGMPLDGQSYCLNRCAASGTLEQFKLLAKISSEFPAHSLNLMDRTRLGFTPIHYAARRGDVKMVQYMIENGADVEQKNGIGQTPLMAAVEGHCTPEILRYLIIDKGCKYTSRDSFRMNALDYAKDSRDSSVVSMLGSIILLASKTKFGLNLSERKHCRNLSQIC